MQKIIDLALFLKQVFSIFIIRILLLGLVFGGLFFLVEVFHYGSINNIFLASKLEKVIQDHIDKARYNKKAELIDFTDLSAKGSFGKACLINPNYKGERYELERIPEINPHRFYYWIKKSWAKKAKAMIFFISEKGDIIPVYINNSNIDESLSIQCIQSNTHTPMLNIDSSGTLKIIQ